MCLIEDQDIQIVGFRGHERIEVLKGLLHARVSLAGDLAQGLADALGIDLLEAADAKLSEARRRFPASVVLSVAPEKR